MKLKFNKSCGGNPIKAIYIALYCLAATAAVGVLTGASKNPQDELKGSVENKNSSKNANVLEEQKNQNEQEKNEHNDENEINANEKNENNEDLKNLKLSFFDYDIARKEFLRRSNFASKEYFSDNEVIQFKNSNFIVLRIVNVFDDEFEITLQNVATMEKIEFMFKLNELMVNEINGRLIVNSKAIEKKLHIKDFVKNVRYEKIKINEEVFKIIDVDFSCEGKIILTVNRKIKCAGENKEVVDCVNCGFEQQKFEINVAEIEKEIEKNKISQEAPASILEIMIKNLKPIEVSKQEAKPKAPCAASNEAAGDLAGKEVLNGVATAYAAKGNCCNGVKATVGCAAVDPRKIPLGSIIEVFNLNNGKSYGTFTACDIGGAMISGRVLVDLCLGSEAACRAFGKKRVKVVVKKRGTGTIKKRMAAAIQRISDRQNKNNKSNKSLKIKKPKKISVLKHKKNKAKSGHKKH